MKKGLQPFVFLLLLLFIFPTHPATADTIYLYPDADTFIISVWPTDNHGANTGLMVGKLSNGGDLHTRIRFSGIPSGANIQSAELRLYRTMGSGSHTLSVQSASRSWSENTLTWNSTGSTNRYTTPNSTYSMSNQTGYVNIDVTSHVREWADGTRTNYGFHLSTDGTIGENHTFASRESGTSSYWPKLEMTYSTPPPDPDIRSVSGIPSSVTVGELFTVTVTAENDDGASPEGAINASVLYSDGTDNVVVDGPDASWADGTYNRAPGYYPIYNNNCQAMTAQDHMLEVVDSDWQNGESHSMSFTVTPQKEGTLYVRVRTTMRNGPVGDCDYRNDTSASGGSSGTDQQGWTCRVYTVTVAENIVSISEITLDRIPNKTSETGFALAGSELWSPDRVNATLTGLGVHVLVKVTNATFETFTGCVVQPHLIDPDGNQHSWGLPSGQYHGQRVVLEPGDAASLIFPVYGSSSIGMWEIPVYLKEGSCSGGIIDSRVLSIEVIRDTEDTVSGPEPTYGDLDDLIYRSGFELINAKTLLAYNLLNFAVSLYTGTGLNITYFDYLNAQQGALVDLLNTASISIRDNGVIGDNHSFEISWYNTLSAEVYYDRCIVVTRIPTGVEVTDAGGGYVSQDDDGNTVILWFDTRVDKRIKPLFGKGEFFFSIGEPAYDIEIEVAISLLVGPIQGIPGSTYSTLYDYPTIYNWEKWNADPHSVYWTVVGHSAISKSITTSYTCSPADTNRDGFVGIVELIHYIGEWKNGPVTIVELMQAIGEWKHGCGE